MSKLTGKVAVITGASRGIGAAIAKALAAEGASVVVNHASSKAGADKIVDEICQAGGKAVAVRGDASKAAEAQSIVAATIENHGLLDILVNNSGVYAFAPSEEVTFIGSAFEAGTVAQTPLGRMGQPDDIASVAVFLASEDSTWLTGEQLLVGGGLH